MHHQETIATMNDRNIPINHQIQAIIHGLDACSIPSRESSQNPTMDPIGGKPTYEPPLSTLEVKEFDSVSQPKPRLFPT